MDLEERLQTEDELLAEAEKRAKDIADVNYLVGMLNAEQTPIIEVEVMTPDGLKLINIGLLNYALDLQLSNPTGHQATKYAEYVMFNDICLDVPGHEIVKRHYVFDALARSCALTITWAQLDAKNQTKDQPRYDVTHYSDKVPDNHTWKLIINKTIDLSGQPGFHFLYHHNFVMIIDEEEKVVSVIPEGTEPPL